MIFSYQMVSSPTEEISDLLLPNGQCLPTFLECSIRHVQDVQALDKQTPNGKCYRHMSSSRTTTMPPPRNPPA